MLQVNNYNNALLQEINFSFKPHQKITILGSNGAGKSTLAKLLCGITPSKEVTLYNQEVSKINPKERTKYINYIPPKLEVFDEYITLEEYLELSQIRTHLEPKNILKFLEIEHLIHKPIHKLSSGEEQLAMISSAILHNAQITIFDEPTANLDPKKSQEIFYLLKSKLFQGRIIITHDLNLAYHLGYDILYLKEGRIDFLAPSKEFFNEYNLHHFFGSSIKKVEQFIVGNL